MAELIEQNRQVILDSNKIDLETFAENDKAIYDRLIVNNSKIDGMIESLKQIASQEDPVGKEIFSYINENGLEICNRTDSFGTVMIIYESRPDVTIEALIPDFDGRTELINKVIISGQEVVSHNLETVRRITPWARSRAKYDTSFKTLEVIANSDVVSKSGIMVGLGETFDEVIETMDDLRNIGVEVFTIGQYLQPTKKHLKVKEYITPEQFARYRKIGLEKGFRFVESSPLVRSSYQAERHVQK